MSQELESYDYHLPSSLIATYPMDRRTQSRLLVYQHNHGRVYSRQGWQEWQDRRFYEIVDFLQPKDLLIINDTYVSARRLRLKRSSGGHIAALFLQELPNKHWSCLLSNSRKLDVGERLYYDGVIMSSYTHSDWEEIEFVFYPARDRASHPSLLPVLAGTETPAWQNKEQVEHWFLRYGEPPIPPYLKRKAETIDKERYQTVYADPEQAGSTAAPTAGLHFSPELLEKIRAKGVELVNLQLQIGYATFAPLKPANFSENRLHQEHYSISPQAALQLNQAQGRRIAVGTSTLRALETNFRCHHGKFVSGRFATDLFLQPPDKPLSIGGLVTNFHLPKSSLLLLVASYIGKKQVLKLYRHAVQQQYRFF